MAATLSEVGKQSMVPPLRLLGHGPLRWIWDFDVCFAGYS